MRLVQILVSVVLILLVLACAKRQRQNAETRNQANVQQSNQTQFEGRNQQQPQRININTASANELETLPGIGKALAARIIEHREKYGPFRKPEHLIIVRGISDKRFEALRDLITVE
jgi:competence ComEA-like helix-hairpin-helix protein